jgi:hypothetical protein
METITTKQALKQALKKLPPGDSITASIPDVSIKYIRSVASVLNQQTGRKYTCSVKDMPKGSIKIWRKL